MKSVHPLFLSVLLSSQFFTGSSFAQVEQDAKPPMLVASKAIVQRLTFAEIETRAKSGDPEAQFQLGRRYSDGWGVAKDLTEAAKWFQKAADQGQTRAQTHLGNQYLEGKGVPKSRSLALLLLRKAADKGDGEAQFKVGVDLKYWAPKKDKAAGVEWYMKAASNGNFQALQSLADIYEKGEEVPKDEAKAAAFLTKAQARFQQFFDELVSEAEAGNPESMLQTGGLYLFSPLGESAKTAFEKLPGSTEYRRAEGIKWMLRAAETSGNPSLLVELGGLYLSGDYGMIKDLDRGNELIREGIAKLKESASKGNAEAAAYLGNAYHYGQLVPKSLQEGEKWWRVAADLGHGASAGMLIYGAKNPPPSKDVRDQWRRLEAESGSATDQYGRGQMFYRGDFETTIDHVEALRWFRRAAEREELGSANAQVAIAVMYSRGEGGLPKDKHRALEWVLKAAEYDKLKDGAYPSDVALYYAGFEELEGSEKQALDWWRKGKLIDKEPFDECAARLEIAKKLRLSDPSIPNGAIQTNAIRWFKKAIQCGSADASWELGEHYAKGSLGMPKSPFEAEQYLDLGANNVTRKFRLARNYQLGFGVSQNYQKAGSLVMEIAASGQKSLVSLMAWELGVAYETGKDVKASPSEAEKFLELGMDSKEKMSYLAHRYLNGMQGLAKNLSKAEALFRHLIDGGLEDYKVHLGAIYFDDTFPLMNKKRAFQLWLEVAENRDLQDVYVAVAQRNIAYCYAQGQGVPKDELEALAWMNIAASSGLEPANESRGEMEASLGRQMTLLAQQRSKEITKTIDAKGKKAPVPPKEKSNPSVTENQHKVSGSGAIVSAQGHILTAAHVVTGAKGVTVITAQGERSATILRVDEANDLAVLKLADGKYPFIPVAQSRKVRLGQPVATIGFPNIDIQGFSPKVTKGEISSLNGIGDDPRSWQVSVPVQPGNSGGPLLDEDGNVVGVVVMKLGTKAAQATGDIPQNVAYAVKSTYALALLEPYLGDNPSPPNTVKMKFEDMVAKTQQSVVLLLVY